MVRKRLAVIAAALAMVATVLTVTAPVGAQAGQTCNGKAATIVGTDGNDRIEGTEGNDVIVGLSGKDVIFGRGGNDTICGGPGNDVIKGGRGNDYVEGNQGNDKLIGGIGRDTMDGGSAKDKVFGGGGPDTLIGGPKKDAVRGQNGMDTCDLDDLDFFATCESGDVIGMNGTGDATHTVTITDDFLLNRYTIGQLNALQNDTRETFVIEVAWVLAPEEPWVVIEVLDAAGETLTFRLLEGEAGLVRFELPTFDNGRPKTLNIEGASAYEVNFMKRENLEKLSRQVDGRGWWVYQLTDPIVGEATYVFDYDPESEFPEIKIFGPFGTRERFDAPSPFGEQTGQLTGTASNGAEVIAVEGLTWSVDVEPA